ncbi:MAG: hypothetical protein A3J46_00725 [Candidatus Yanofskybacteria bacterium RIFCSPHIGHO2_02_FULL_41_11]|uniref:SGNH hydrolase-type esterase domain-containing protein n=1 Tax=Candidatus Yanofskybacteria bacterium RIFCSPHIGHO2_02_FULL_41_11 TaxID=1802675 RepID=A0A1F8FE44_9BACT|nr:MAG: hypothetical protein A3J46_00725 [Candidatus Yanofskybacteria bacterium RIFCSPHIGHO2_02_FULL_41_11]
MNGNSKAKNFIVFFGSLIVCFIILELVLRMLVPVSVFHPGLDLRPNQKLVFDNLSLYGVSKTVRYSTNKWGMRGDPIPQDWDKKKSIIMVGGSTTRDAYISDESTWAYLLQGRLKQLNGEVIVQNAGLDGHSTRGHVLIMQSIIPKIRPKIVIVLSGVNDLGHSLIPERFVSGNPFEKTGWKYNLLARSRAAQFFYVWYQVLVNKTVTSDKANESSSGYDLKPLEKETILPENLKEALPSLGEFKANIRTIITIARSENIKIVFLTQPLLFDDNKYWSKIQGNTWWLGDQQIAISGATYWKMLKIFNESLLEICEAEKVPCFDLGSAIPHDQKYFYDAAHFNNVGAELVAQKTYEFLISNKETQDFINN